MLVVEVRLEIAGVGRGTTAKGQWHGHHGCLMHVKCIHDLCTLPLDIPFYLHHILVIFTFFDDYWE
jgi:hypothetical protein